MTRWSAVLALGIAVLWAGSAFADFTLTLTIGSSFNNGSGVALGANVGLYTGSRDLTITTSATGTPGVLDLSIAGINPMPTIRPALDPSVFYFDVTADPQLTFDAVLGAINGSLTDALVPIDVERRVGQTVVDADSYLIPLTTASIDLPACGPAAPRTVTGTFVDIDPNDGVIDQVTLVGALCMVDFGTSGGFNTPLEIKLDGVLVAECPDIDDGVDCTIDSCDPITFAITHEPDHSACQDANLCNGAEICDPVLDCQAGTPPPIDDGIACTIDSCDPILGVEHAPVDALCSDGDLCTGIEFCDPVLSCQDGTPPVIDDGISCTVDGCAALTGVSHTPMDSLCDDDDSCNGIEACSPTLDCQAGTPVVIDDGIVCTIDSCDPEQGVSHIPSDSVCSDGDVCTGIETCDPVLDCQAGNAPTVDDGVGCTVDACDAILGVSNTPDDAVCSDGNVCTGIESCHAVLDCQAGTALVVDDGVGCTLDVCDPVQGVSNTPTNSLCSDNDACTGIETCDAVLDCQFGAPPVVDDGVACTLDSCDPLLGVSNTPNDLVCSDGDVCSGLEFCDSLLGCQDGMTLVVDDGVGCTIDSCDPVLGVSHVPDDSVCGSGNICTGLEVCDPVLDCQGSDPLDVDDGVGCTIDTCDPVLGAINTPADSLCSDGDVCTGFETCDAVLDCQAGTPIVPDDGVPCTIDSCDPILGVINVPDDSVCGDGDFCNGTEMCDTVLGCEAGSPPDIDDGVSCTVDSCDPVIGVTHVPTSSICDDGDICTGSAYCDATLDCQSTPPPIIDDGIACTIDSCDPILGVANIPDHGLCDDNDVCTGTEVCDVNSGCQGGTPLVVDDGVSCTQDTCHPIQGVSHSPNDSLCSDGSVCTGAETCDAVLDCQAGTPLVVDDGVGCTVDACDPVLGVSHTPNDFACGGGDICTGGEICDVVLDCQPGPPPDIDDGVACTIDACDAVMGVTHTPDDTICSDGNLCTGSETCHSQLGCQAGTPPVVDDGVACTIDTCAALTGVSNAPDDSLCSDGNLCTGVEVCDAALDCQPGTPPIIDDGISCTLDSCSAVSGVANIPYDALCHDGDVCTGFEVCSPVLDCLPGIPLVVDDGIACTVDSCDPVLGVSNNPDDSTCSDGDVCSGVELCSPMLDCQPGTPPVIDDGVACTIDSCDAVTGVANTPDDGFCDDGQLCTGDEVCHSTLGCQAGEPLPVLVVEDFESLPLQVDTTGVFVPELSETFYRVTDAAGTVASVVAVDEGSLAISDSNAGSRVWRIESTSAGPFVADISIPPDPDASFNESGTFAAFFEDPVDLGSALMCVDARKISQERIATLRFIVGDADGNFGASDLMGTLPDDFANFEHSFPQDPLTPLGEFAVDLTRVKTLGFDFWTPEGVEEPFEFEVDNLRLVPEPGSRLLLVGALGTLLALRASLVRPGRRRHRARGGSGQKRSARGAGRDPLSAGSSALGRLFRNRSSEIGLQK